jgi:hypothetical protein
MKYEKPMIAVAGRAQEVVLGAKDKSNIPDAPTDNRVHSALAYEADE